MKEIVEAKLQEARKQKSAWQRQAMQAQEQIVRWDAIRLVCEELLAEGEHEGTKEHEEEESPGP